MCALERRKAKRVGVLASFSHSAAFFSLTHGRWRDIESTTVTTGLAGAQLHDLLPLKGLMFNERMGNGLNPRPVGLQETAGPLLKLQKIAVAVIARPTGALCDERASAPVVG
jgi:hypothetical protein